MASSLCTSTSLTNVFVQRVTVLDITDIVTSESGQKSWTYVLGVTWSDTREHKIYRCYNEVTQFYNQIYKLVASDKIAKSRMLKDLPRVPARGFFDWSPIKLMVRNQSAVDSFLRVLIRFPKQVSRHQVVLDFFELHDRDNQNHVTNQHKNYKSNTVPDTPPREVTIDSCFELTNQNRRSIAPPTFLPIKSCFEPEDDVIPSAGYQILLEDVTPFELYENYENSGFYSSPDYFCDDILTYCDDIIRKQLEEERWRKECEEIISPYSPNKTYFRLVHELEQQDELF